jgi:hypothetical protein
MTENDTQPHPGPSDPVGEVVAGGGVDLTGRRKPKTQTTSRARGDVRERQ